MDSREEAIFSLFKLKNKIPNFGAIVEGMYDFRNTDSKFTRSQLVRLQSKRLKTLFEGFDPKTDYIDIQDDVYVRLLTGFQVPVLQVRYGDQSSDQIPLYNYRYAEDAIAVSISDLGEFIYLPLSQKQFNSLKNVLTPHVLMKAVMNITAKAETVGETKVINGGRYHPLIAKTAQLKLYQIMDEPQEGVLLYRAEWFAENNDIEGDSATDIKAVK